MRYSRMVPDLPASRLLTRVPVLVALALGLLWVGPAGAVPPTQLAGTEATVVADENLNVRAGPGLEQPVGATIPPGGRAPPPRLPAGRRPPALRGRVPALARRCRARVREIRPLARRCPAAEAYPAPPARRSGAAAP